MPTSMARPGGTCMPEERISRPGKQATLFLGEVHHAAVKMEPTQPGVAHDIIQVEDQKPVIDEACIPSSSPDAGQPQCCSIDIYLLSVVIEPVALKPGMRPITHESKQSKCNRCCVTFATREGLRRHNNRLHAAHAAGRSFVCRLCGRAFHRSDNCKQHQKTHGDAKPFACDQCGEKFKANRYLRRHMQSLRDAPNIKLDCALSQLKLWDVPGASTGCFHVWCSECRLAHERHFPADVDLEHIEALSREKCRVGVNDIHLDGLRLILDFVTESEEAALVESIDSRPWAPSQSGRRKQDYGPKVNFKKQKLKLDIFEGVPHYAPMLLSRMEHSGITDYVPVEMCNLEYCKSKASAIEPHIDDTWVWGERLISVNLLSGAVIVFVSVSTDQCVFVHMPRRSLLMISGPCRYEWRHAVTSFHMDQSRRIALTMREAASRFKPGGQLYESGGGRQLLEKGSTVLGAGHGIFCVGDDLMDRDLPPLG